MRAGAAAVVLLLGLGACGEGAGAPSGDTPEGGDERTTAGALAHVAAEHAGTPDSAARSDDAAEVLTSDEVGVELRYGSDGEYDGDMLLVAAGRGLDASLLGCDGEQVQSLDGCEVTERGVLMWEDEEPEEDPGGVYVLVEKGGAAALVLYAGPSITGDPRELDLPISAETLFAIANDPRVDVTTSAEAVEAGADLPYWRGPAG